MLDFHETYMMTDVWVEFNKKTGKNQYIFWHNGKTYGRETIGETHALIQELKTKGVER